MNKYDVIIVGCGPAGIFTALEMLKKAAKEDSNDRKGTKRGTPFLS